MEIAVLALGCFWEPEIKFSKLNGVVKTEVGYCGGITTNTNYKEVCSGKTNHAEVVRVEFDNSTIAYKDILNYFFEIHDPTTINQQGPNIGSQYRSEIFYLDQNQKKIATNTLNKFNEKYNGKIVTKISEIKNYSKAEDYHQKYLEKNLNYVAS